MKKITLSVAALLIAINGFCTNPPTNKQLVREMSMTVEDVIQSIRTLDTTEISKMYVHNLLVVLSQLEDLQVLNYNSVTFTKYEVTEMSNTIGDILEWQNQDIEEADYNSVDPHCGRYSEKWGSNYWLTLMEEQLYNKLNNNRYEVSCENCDEID
tara:strand:- start:1201 stop:1665 length:465 start_codon:yes stop_codon:yes gene_type:complete